MPFGHYQWALSYDRGAHHTESSQSPSPCNIQRASSSIYVAPRSGDPMLAVPLAELIAGCGIRDDRNFKATHRGAARRADHADRCRRDRARLPRKHAIRGSTGAPAPQCARHARAIAYADGSGRQSATGRYAFSHAVMASRGGGRDDQDGHRRPLRSGPRRGRRNRRCRGSRDFRNDLRTHPGAVIRRVDPFAFV